MRLAEVMEVVVRGRVIGTTGEHPFFALGKGWVAASELVAGDLINRDDGQWVAVEATRHTGKFETVYNLRVADWHTYFVGSSEWGFSVWAHNLYEFDVAPYGKFKAVIDKVAGHEMLQHSWLKAWGFVSKSRDPKNIAMGLEKLLHKLVWAEQKTMGLLDGPKAMLNMSALENITQNAIAMVRTNKIPLSAIENQLGQSIQYGQSLKVVAAGADPIQSALSRVRSVWAQIQGII